MEVSDEGPVPPLRRTPREVANLEARILKELIESPGLTRAEISRRIGVDLARIDRLVTNLLHAGKVARDGHKTSTRYWPSGGVVISSGVAREHA